MRRGSATLVRESCGLSTIYEAPAGRGQAPDGSRRPAEETTDATRPTETELALARRDAAPPPGGGRRASVPRLAVVALARRRPRRPRRGAPRATACSSIATDAGDAQMPGATWRAVFEGAWTRIDRRPTRDPERCRRDVASGDRDATGDRRTSPPDRRAERRGRRRGRHRAPGRRAFFRVTELSRSSPERDGSTRTSWSPSRARRPTFVPRDPAPVRSAGAVPPSPGAVSGGARASRSTSRARVPSVRPGDPAARVRARAAQVQARGSVCGSRPSPEPAAGTATGRAPCRRATRGRP